MILKRTLSTGKKYPVGLPCRILYVILDAMFQSREVWKAEGLYLKRWFVTPLSWLEKWPWWLSWVPEERRTQVFLHNIRLPDSRIPHSHPWAFKTRILAGAYVESCSRKYTYFDLESGKSKTALVSMGLRLVTMGDVVENDLDHVHYVTVDPKRPVWSLVVAGKPEREWGFWVDGPSSFETMEYHPPRWVHWRDYLNLPDEPDSPEDVVR